MKVVKKVLLTIVGVLYFAFALCMTILLLNYNKYGITQFGETSLIIIKEDVSFDGYKKGDLVLVKDTKIKDLKENDVVFAYKLDENRAVHVQVGNVGKIYEEEQAITFKNGNTYSKEFLADKPYEVHNNIGTVLSVIESQWGFLFIVLVPIFLIFIYQVYALIVEIKYGADKD